MSKGRGKGARAADPEDGPSLCSLDASTMEQGGRAGGRARGGGRRGGPEARGEGSSK